MLRLRLNRRLDLWSSRRRSSSRLFVMSNQVETSLTVLLLKIRDSSTAPGMTKKARSRQTNLLRGGRFRRSVSGATKTDYEQN